MLKIFISALLIPLFLFQVNTSAEEKTIEIIHEPYEGVIFLSNHEFKLRNDLNVDDKIKWDVSIDDIEKAEEWVKEYLTVTEYLEDSIKKHYFAGDYSFILNNFQEYFRQYLGIYDENGDRIILINYSLGHKDYSEIIFVLDGGPAYYIATINIDKKKVIAVVPYGSA